MRSVTFLSFLFSQLLLLHFLVVIEETLLDLGALHVQLVEVKLILVGFNLFSAFTGTSSSGHVTLTSVTGLIGMSKTRLGTETDITESIFFVVEFRILVIEVIAGSSSLSRVLFILCDLTELVRGAVGHGIENLDNVFGFLLEDGVFGEVSEFVVNALGPVANLIVNNVHAFESVSKNGEVLHDER